MTGEFGVTSETGSYDDLLASQDRQQELKSEFRRQIALQTLGVLESIEPEDIIITNGCTEAVALSLLAVTRPGDTVAIEAPTNLTFLQLLKELGLLVAEVATDPRRRGWISTSSIDASAKTKSGPACSCPTFKTLSAP